MTGEEHETSNPLGPATSAYQTGDSRLALQLLDDELAKLQPGDTVLKVILLVQKAQWLRESGYPEAGATALDDAVCELDRQPRSGSEMEWSSVRMEQGAVARQRGDFKAAEAFLAEAEELGRQSPARDVYLPDVLANQASLYLDQGRFSEAQGVLLSALEIDQRMGNKRNESNDLNMLGLVYGHLGDAATSRVYLTWAYEVAYQAGQLREASDAMANLAALMDDSGDHAGAEEIFRNVELMKAEGGDESGVACSVAGQGVTASRSGDLERAMTLFTRSRELHLAAGNRLHGVQDLLNLSSVETMRDHHDQALSYAEEALAAARDFGLIELLWCAEYAVATCRTNLARDSDNGSGGFEPFEEALAGLRRAADVVELLRSKVDSPEGRESLLGGKEKIYEDAVILCIGLGRAKEAFEFCERARMRSFLEALGSSRLERLEAGDPGAQRRGQLVELLLSPRTPPGEKAGLLDELRILRAERASTRPAVAAITEAELPTIDDIRQAIPADTCVVEYFQAGRAWIIFLLNQDGLQGAGTVTTEVPLETVIQQFRDEIYNGDTELVAGAMLFQAFLSSVLPSLEKVRDLIVVPHRSLHYVPFSALWYEPAGDYAPPRQYLKNTFTLTTIPSASYLPYLTRTAPPDREYGAAVVLGNPTRDLAGAELEARQVAAKLGVTARLGPSATREALLGAAAPAVLHVASHGSYNVQDPLLSGLALADGVVTVEDLLSSGPAPGLLVLSGCVTGMSKTRPGDELIGLAQAALRCGTRSVVAALWETFDESSAVFFGHFYDALIEGIRVGEAIGWARDALAKGPGGYQHPVDWAPFLLFGDPDQCLTERDHTPMAEVRRGLQLVDQGDVAGAKSVLQQVVGSGSGLAPGWAAFRIGMLLRDEGDFKDAQAVWQQVADSGHPEAAPLALWGIGCLLDEQEDFDGARAAYEQAIASGHPDAARRAAINLRSLLVRHGEIKSAWAGLARLQWRRTRRHWRRQRDRPAGTSRDAGN